MPLLSYTQASSKGNRERSRVPLKEHRPLDHAAAHLGVSWGVVAELVQLVGPRVNVKYPRPHTRIEFGGVGGPRSRETQKLHLLIQRADRQHGW